MEVILHAIRGLGGTVLKTNVDVERARLIQAGLPAQAVPMLVGAGALSGSGHMDLAVSILAAMTATLGADVLWYSLGRSPGVRVLEILCRDILSSDCAPAQAGKPDGEASST